jgi:hypothetical protein
MNNIPGYDFSPPCAVPGSPHESLTCSFEPYLEFFAQKTLGAMTAEWLPTLLARSVDNTNTSKEMTAAAASAASKRRRRTIRLISMTVSKLIITKIMISTLHFSGLYKDELGRDVIGSLNTNANSGFYEARSFSDGSLVHRWPHESRSPQSTSPVSINI